MEKVDYLALEKLANEIGRLNESIVDFRENEKNKVKLLEIFKK